MRIRRENYAFLFSVEGKTEKWYLEHLQNLIKGTLEAKNATFTVTLNAKVEKNPLSYIKTLSPGSGVENSEGKTIITHLFDYESPLMQDAGADRLALFQETLKKMKEAKAKKAIEYRLAYSNLSFDLWIILHKKDSNGTKTKCDQYLAELNEAYRKGKKEFASLGEYKEKDYFKEVLEEITLSDVHKAVDRASKIQLHNKQYYKKQSHCGYDFFKDNPSLSLHERIQELFDFCKQQGCSV